MVLTLSARRFSDNPNIFGNMCHAELSMNYLLQNPFAADRKPLRISRDAACRRILVQSVQEVVDGDPREGRWGKKTITNIIKIYKISFEFCPFNKKIPPENIKFYRKYHDFGNGVTRGEHRSFLGAIFLHYG